MVAQSAAGSCSTFRVSSSFVFFARTIIALPLSVALVFTFHLYRIYRSIAKRSSAESAKSYSNTCFFSQGNTCFFSQGLNLARFFFFLPFFLTFFPKTRCSLVVSNEEFKITSLHLPTAPMHLPPARWHRAQTALRSSHLLPVPSCSTLITRTHRLPLESVHRNRRLTSLRPSRRFRPQFPCLDPLQARVQRYPRSLTF